MFCRGLLKYGEQEMRTRTEQAVLKENQYKHLIYLKDQQNMYYKRKCEEFLSEIDKLVNAKLTQKGNQIIYDLDVSTRELRMLKDNFYLMERLMRQELRHEYERGILEREQTIQRFREAFVTYKSELNNEIKEEVAKEIMSLDRRVKVIAKKNTVGKVQQEEVTVMPEMKKGRGEENKRSGGYYEEESRREINALGRFIRMYKVFARMKEVLMVERHERELYN